jgi:hypothetical protein
VWLWFADWLAALPPSHASFLGAVTGSFFGLFALLLGALFNAWLNRRRDNYLRNVERAALARSIYAELTGVRRTLLENAQRLIDHPPEVGEGFNLPDLHHSVQVFTHMLPKIGLLRTDTIRQVMDAYVLIEQYGQEMIQLGGVLLPTMPENRRVIFMGAFLSITVPPINRARAEFIKGAIDALEPYL